MENYYKILGVPQNASADEIRKAYHTQAKRYHPDTGGSEEMFKRVGTAYSILSDPQKRADYDLTLRQQQEQARRQSSAASGGNGRKSASSASDSGRRSGGAGSSSARGPRSSTAGSSFSHRSGADQETYRSKARQEGRDSMDSAWDLWHEIFGEFEEDVWSAFAGAPFGRSSGFSRRRQGENLYDENFQDDDGFQYDDPFQAYHEDWHRAGSHSGSRASRSRENRDFERRTGQRSGSGTSRSRKNQDARQNTGKCSGSWSSQTGSRKGKAAARVKTPQDLRATVKITASEARTGCRKKIHVHYKDVENGNVYDKFRVDRSYLAEIPAGAYDGMKIRLQGAGKPPEAGGSGNVIVTVKVVGQ